MLELSSGDLYWVENQYFMVNMFLKKDKKRIFREREREREEREERERDSFVHCT